MRSKVIFILLALSLSISCKATDQTAPTDSKPEKEIKIDKNAWVGNMKSSLPKLLCQKDQYFMKCYDVTLEECMKLTNLYVQACLNNVALTLPQEITKQQGENGGQIVGRCSYDLYEKFVKPKKRSLAECQNVKPKEGSPESPRKPNEPN